MRSANASFLLLVEGARTDEIAPIADCSVKEFKPYLKRGKTLKVYGFGPVCVASGRALGN
jgi:hypothetical protein